MKNLGNSIIKKMNKNASYELRVVSYELFKNYVINHVKKLSIFNSQFSILNSQSGAAFLMVVISMLVLYIIATGFTVMVANQAKGIKADRNKLRAQYIAEAGLNLGAIRSLHHPMKLTNSSEWECDTYGGDPADGWCPYKGGHFQVQAAWLDDETKRITANGKFIDSSGGSPILLTSKQSFNIKNPFNKVLWSSKGGKVRFESMFPDPIGCITGIFWPDGGPQNVWWNIFGHFYADSEPQTDYQEYCCGIKVCCFFGKGDCPWYKWCCNDPPWCLGWKITQGARYRTNTHECNYGKKDRCYDEQYFGSVCTADNTDTAVHSGSIDGWNYTSQFDDNPPSEQPHYHWWRRNEEGMPFPQFRPPADPEWAFASHPTCGNMLSSTGLTKMCGPNYKTAYCAGFVPGTGDSRDAAQFLKDNKYLRDVWIDGDLTIDYTAFEVIGVEGIGIFGTVYVDGRLNYHGSWLASLAMYAYDGFKNYTGSAGDLGYVMWDAGYPPEDKQPGTLIVNRGDIDIWSVGTPYFGRVNIVAINGDIKISSRCGMVSLGSFYAGGTEVDPKTKLKTGGTIEVKCDQAYGLDFLCDVISGWIQKGGGIPLRANNIFTGSFIAKNIIFIGTTNRNIIAPNNYLWVADGFYSALRVWDYRLED